MDRLKKQEREWWIALAEEVLGRRVSDEEAQLDLMPLELKEGETNFQVLIPDLSRYQLLGFKLALNLIAKNFHSDSRSLASMTVREIGIVIPMIRNGNDFFWNAIRLRVPDAQTLRFGLWQGLPAVISVDTRKVEEKRKVENQEGFDKLFTEFLSSLGF